MYETFINMIFKLTISWCLSSRKEWNDNSYRSSSHLKKAAAASTAAKIAKQTAEKETIIIIITIIIIHIMIILLSHHDIMNNICFVFLCQCHMNSRLFPVFLSLRMYYDGASNRLLDHE